MALARQQHVAGLDLRHVENIVDDVEEMLAAIVDVAGVFIVLGRAERAEHLVLQDFRKAEDGVERRAELMGHVGQEFRLRPVGAFRAFLLDEIVGVGDRELSLLAVPEFDGKRRGRRSSPSAGAPEFAQALLVALQRA